MHQPAGTGTRDLGDRRTADSGLLELVGLASLFGLNAHCFAWTGFSLQASFYLFLSDAGLLWGPIVVYHCLADQTNCLVVGRNRLWT